MERRSKRAFIASLGDVGILEYEPARHAAGRALSWLVDELDLIENDDKLWRLADTIELYRRARYLG